MPDEYIKRGDALLEIESIPKGNWSTKRFVDAIEKVPAADVEPVRHGHWVYKMRERNKTEKVTGFDELGFNHTVIVNTHVKGKVPYCSECNALAADSFLDFCPHCGAKMDGEPKEEDDEE